MLYFSAVSSDSSRSYRVENLAIKNVELNAKRIVELTRRALASFTFARFQARIEAADRSSRRRAYSQIVAGN